MAGMYTSGDSLLGHIGVQVPRDTSSGIPRASTPRTPHSVLPGPCSPFGGGRRRRGGGDGRTNSVGHGVMVMVPVFLPTLAQFAASMTMVNCSLVSAAGSWRMVTGILPRVLPAGIVTLPPET